MHGAVPYLYEDAYGMDVPKEDRVGMEGLRVHARGTLLDAHAWEAPEFQAASNSHREGGRRKAEDGFPAYQTPFILL